jgi:hypothetical protein
MSSVSQTAAAFKYEIERGGSLAGPPAADGRRGNVVATVGAGEAATLPLAPFALVLVDPSVPFTRGAQLALGVSGVQHTLDGHLSLAGVLACGEGEQAPVETADQLALAGVPYTQLALVAREGADRIGTVAEPEDECVRAGWRQVRAGLLALAAAAVALVGVARGDDGLPQRPEAASAMPAEGGPPPEGRPFMFNGGRSEKTTADRVVAGADTGPVASVIKFPPEFTRWMLEQLRLDREIAAAAAPLVEATTECTCEFSPRVCPEHGTKGWRYYQGPDHVRSCKREGCRKKSARKRGKRARTVLGRLGESHWSVDEITVPASMQPGLAASALYRKRVLAAARDTLWGWLIKWSFRGERVLLGSAIFEHPCGSDEREWRWHLHCVTPLVGVRTRDEGVEQGRYKVKVEALDDFRALWRARLLKEFGVDVPQVDVHHGFARAGASFDDVVERHDQVELDGCDAKRTHASNYVSRTFPSWSPCVQRPHYLGLLSHAGQKRWESAQAKREVGGKGRVNPAPAPQPREDEDCCDECGVELEAGPTFHAYGSDVYAGPLSPLMNWRSDWRDRRLVKDLLAGRTGPPPRKRRGVCGIPALTPYAPPVGSTRGTPAEGWLVRPYSPRKNRA